MQPEKQIPECHKLLTSENNCEKPWLKKPIYSLFKIGNQLISVLPELFKCLPDVT